MGYRLLVVDDSATLRTLMRTVLEEAGHSVDVAVDGADGLERVQRARYDLVLVDFVMPRLNGYQFTQALRAIPALRATRVLLVSAKAEQIGARFVAQTHAVGALQKPFSPSALCEAVVGALASAVLPLDETNAGFVDEEGTQGRGASLEHVHEARTVALPAMGAQTLMAAAAALAARQRRAASDSAVHPVPTAPVVRSMGEGTAPHAPKAPSQAVVDVAHARFTEALARDLWQAFQDVSNSQVEVTEESVLQLMRFYLSRAKVGALFHTLRPLEAGFRSSVALDGMLELVPLGEVFQLLALQSQTGLLVVERSADAGGAVVTFALRAGRIDLAVGREMPHEFRLGRYLIEAGHLTPSHLNAVLESIAGQRMLLGRALVTGGFIREEHLEQALERQTRELLFDVLRWSAGRFRFEAGASITEAQQARLELPSEHLVLEGYRRLDEWRLIAEHLPSERTVLTRDESVVATLPREELGALERRVLDAIDGRRSVRDVIDAVAMSSFDACKIVHRLLQARLVAPGAA
jgi:CheY-like chemotaxis protein